MNSIDLITFFGKKREHYPISDEFIELYQQKDDGNENSYLTYAHETKHEVDANKHETNQKWHLVEAYYIDKLIEKNGISSFAIGKIKSPELLLWMAEAAEIEEKIVQDASDWAKEKIDEIRNAEPKRAYSAEAVCFMDKKMEEKYGCNLWKMIVDKVKNRYQVPMSFR